MLATALTDTYVVAELDLEATLREVADPEIRAEIQTIKPIRCLMYLDFVRAQSCVSLQRPCFLLTSHATQREMPYYRAKACHYSAMLIGPSLRSAIPEQFITSDMCTPIFPNTDHPTGYPPVHTEPPFPFTNCYHWFGPDMDIQVRVKITSDEEICGPVDGEPSPSGSRNMLPRTRRKMGFMGMMAEMQEYALWRVEEMEQMHEEAVRVDFAAELPDAEADLFPCPSSDEIESSEPTSAASSIPDQRNQSCESMTSSHDAESVYSETSEYCSSTASLGEKSTLVDDDNPDCLPTLRVWTNLAAHLAQENIPDPVAFVDQYHAVTR